MFILKRVNVLHGKNVLGQCWMVLPLRINVQFIYSIRMGCIRMLYLMCVLPCMAELPKMNLVLREKVKKAVQKSNMIVFSQNKPSCKMKISENKTD